MTRMRYLKGSKGSEQPGELIFVDTETVPLPSPHRRNVDHHHFRLGCAIYGRWNGSELTNREVIHFTDADAFWPWLASKLHQKRPVWIFAHNWHFDAAALKFWKYWETGEYGFQDRNSPRPSRTDEQVRGKQSRRGKLVIESIPFIVYARHRLGSVRLVDTLNYWRCSLAELGQSFGFPKLPFPDFADPDETWAVYCENDARVLEVAVTSLLKEWRSAELGSWQPTAPMLAFGAYKHRFMRQPILLHDDVEVKKLEREAFYGGRQACWFYGYVTPPASPWLSPVPPRPPFVGPVLEGPLVSLDVRSLYPAVMKWRRFPWKLVGHCRAVSVATLTGMLGRYGCVARVTIGGPTAEYPYRVERQTLYPVGLYVTTLCGEELRAAVAAGHVQAVHEVAAYEEADLFSTWVDHWHGERVKALDAGNVARERLCKMLLVSLPGKFGQRSARWVDSPDTLSPIPWGHFCCLPHDGGQPQKYRSIGWHCQSEGERGESNQGFPAIAAWITAAGRQHMNELRAVCPARSIVYQHTDSLVVTMDGEAALVRAGLIRNGELGYLRSLGVHETCTFRGVGNYTVDGRDVVSGIRRGAKRIGPATWEQLDFEGPDSLYSRPPDGTVEVRTVKVTRPGQHRSQRVGPDGWADPMPLGF